MKSIIFGLVCYCFCFIRFGGYILNSKLGSEDYYLYVGKFRFLKRR